MNRLTSALFSLLIAALGLSPATGQELQTVAERTDYAETGTFDDVRGFAETLAAQSELVTLLELGETVEGRSLPLMVLADPPVSSAAEARAGDKLVAMLIGNIHAGEVCGKEALQMLARELALEPGHPLLEQFVVCIAPIYNADGNERMEAGNRPGQVGPDRMGVRPNAQGYDLNRDFIKAEAPETRALLKFFRDWDPHVFVDAHTTNGSYHRYVLTYSGPKHPGGDVQVLEYVRDTMLPRVTESLREEHGHETFTYGNFNRDKTQWTTFPAAPRYSTNYVGMRNRIAILSEAYSYATFEERVIATLDFCRAVLVDVGSHASEVRAMLDAADERTIAAAVIGAETPIRTTPVALPDIASVRGFVEIEEEGRRVRTDEARDYELEILDNFVARVAVERPWAYVLPQERRGIAHKLQQHGISVEVIREDVQVDAGVYTLDSVEQPEREWQGHRMATVTATATEQSHDVTAGDYLVRADQALGNLVVAMLEPQAEDSLLSWNFFDDVLDVGATYPVVRLEVETPLLTADVPLLDEDRPAKKRITYEALYESRDRPSLGGSPMRGVSWVDDEHYTVRRGRETWRVEASTGRYVEVVESAQRDNGPVIEAIAGLASFDDRAAKQIVDRGRYAAQAGGHAIFAHENDLYAVALDGSFARRLTATPEEEELASLSPDGRYAAFVRSHDLYSVEVTSGIERRLTTTGTEKIRNGKNAWVYFEEIFGRNWRSYWWSPDSGSIAFLEMDSRDVDIFTLVDDAVEPHEVEVTEYPKPGSPNPEVRVGVISAAGGEPAFSDLDEYTSGGFVISSVGWLRDSSKMYFTIQDRAQTWLDLCTVPRGGTEATRLLRDQTEAWIDAPSHFQLLEDGSFLLTSERSGWKHLYHYSDSGVLLNQITDGDWEFRGVVRLDTENDRLYFNSTAESPIGLSLCSVNLDGSDFRVHTPGRGTHRASVSPGGSYVVDSWSTVHSPDRTVLRDASGEILRTLDSNPVFELDEWELGEIEHVKIPTTRVAYGEEVELEGLLIYPPDFDPGRRYPVWFRTYAGPHAPSVRDTWSGGRTNDRMLADAGFIVFISEPYSASGKGARSAWIAYEQLGVPEMEDINDMMEWLKAKPYVDGSRIGMSGFSYGGFMTSYAMTHSKHFAAGIAGGSVTSWRDYDTIYTERYMNTPQENPEGYEKTSVVAAAGDLHGDLLIVHGWMDDNVHPQNSIKLIRALQEADKDFEMMFYPRFRHGIWSAHYRRLNYEFQMRLIDREPSMSDESESLGSNERRREGRAGRNDGVRANRRAPASRR